MNEFYKFSDEYAEAVENNDYEAIFEYGKRIISIFEGKNSSQTESIVLALAYDRVAHVYEMKRQYEEAVDNYKKYLPLCWSFGWDDGAIYTEAKILALTSQLDLYIESPNEINVFYGARFEPKSGIYFGATYDNDPRILSFEPVKIRQCFPKENSVYLVYLEFGDSINTGLYNKYFETAKRDNKAIELAWNTYDSLSNVEEYEGYIKETLEYIGKSGVNVFLRFACEMNIMENGDDKEAYIRSFRYVSNMAKKYSNIAFVWSPNAVCALDKPFKELYPGDEYVDWIGVNLFMTKYFLGKKDHGSQQDSLSTYFFTNEYNSPLLCIKPIMEFIDSNKIQKPVLITEGGIVNYIRTENEYTSSWGVKQMELYYGELIRRYPNIKGMCYFNVDIPHENNRYSLFDSPELNEAYNTYLENPYFISKIGENAPYCYKKIEEGLTYNNSPLNLSVSAYYPKQQDLMVKYLLNGNEIFSTSKSPYEFTLQEVPVGESSLSIEVYSQDIKVLEKTYALYNGIVQSSEAKNGQSESNTIHELPGEKGIRLMINNAYFTPSQPPIMENDRVLVPLRVIAEALGATVNWHGDTETITIEKENRIILMQINSDVVLINGESILIDVPPRLINDRTMVPVRAVSTALGSNVDWDGVNGTVIVTSLID